MMVVRFEKAKRGCWFSAAKTLDGGYYKIKLKAALVTKHDCPVWFYGWHAMRCDSMGRVQQVLGGFEKRSDAQKACDAHWLRN